MTASLLTPLELLASCSFELLIINKDLKNYFGKNLLNNTSTNWVFPKLSIVNRFFPFISFIMFITVTHSLAKSIINFYVLK